MPGLWKMVHTKHGVLSTLFLPISVFLSSAALFLSIQMQGSQLYFEVSPNQYLIFHTTAEFISIAVSFSIFGISWFTFTQSKNKHAILLGIGSLAIAIMDLLHTFSYQGMPDFVTPNTANKAAQLWIIARLFSALLFWLSAHVNNWPPIRWVNRYVLLLLAFMISGAAYWVVIGDPTIFPTMFIPTIGLTPLKIFLEYVIIAISLFAIIAYIRMYRHSGEICCMYLISGLIISLFSELAFTLYKSPYDVYNLLGHVYKIFVFALTYWALFKLAVEDPYLSLHSSWETTTSSEAKFSAVFQAFPYLLAITEPETGKLIEVNEAYTSMLGFSREESIGKTTIELDIWKNPKDRDRFVGKLNKFKAVDNFRTSFIKKDKSEIDVTDFARMVKIQGKEYILSIAIDVSQEVELEHAKKDFLVLASHHLRTLPGVIKWTLELLSPKILKILKGDEIEYWENMEEANLKMITLAKEISVAADVGSGKLDIALDTFDITKLIDEEIYKVKQWIKTNQLKVSVDYNGDTTIVSDKQKVRMIINILLSNAVRYISSGEQVRIHTSVKNDKILIRIEDTGWGIPESQQQRVFSGMFRGEKVSKIDVTGIGLGLYIARMITEKLDGKIWVESKEGVGSTFWVELPQNLAD